VGASLWDALAAAGGSLALAFIVALVLGICANAVLFFGSAVVVLERFARGPKRWSSTLLMTLGFAALLGALGTDEESVEALGIPWPGTARAWLAASASAFVLLVLVQAGTALLLRVLTPRVLALASVVGLGVGYALLVGGLDQLGYALAPAVVTALSALALRWRRRWLGARSAGFDERLATTLAAVLALGVGVPLALSQPDLRVGSAGGSLLMGFVGLVVFGLLPRAAAGFLDARGSVEWFIARRYLFAKRRQTFISVITAICVGGVAAGVWLIITVLSVMNGFERVWREEIIGNRAHLTTTRWDRSRTTAACSTASRPCRTSRAPRRTSTRRAWCAGRAARSWGCAYAVSIRNGSARSRICAPTCCPAPRTPSRTSPPAREPLQAPRAQGLLGRRV